VSIPGAAGNLQRVDPDETVGVFHVVPLRC
jgi:hypothetical protein